MALVLDSLLKSIEALNAVLGKANDDEFMRTLDEVTQNAIKSGVIQHFEFTYELCWKFIKRWIEMNVSSLDKETVIEKLLSGDYELKNEPGDYESPSPFEYPSIR